MKIYKRAVLRKTLLMAAMLSLYTIYEAVAFQVTAGVRFSKAV
jgi:hypothetical protein